MGDPPALQGLPGLRPVLLRPLKNQPTPPVSLSLPICKSPLPAGHLGYPWCFFTVLLLFVLRRSCFPSSWPGAWRPSLPREAAVGSMEEELGGRHWEETPSGFLSVAGVGGQLLPAFHLGLFMQQLSHSQAWPAPLMSTPGFATDLQCGLGHCTSEPQSPGFC